MNMKQGANAFIDIIEKATDGTADGIIGSGSHIGIVSFSDTAVANTQLITSVAALKGAVNGLTADGFTNHGDAFVKALQLFNPTSSNARVIVMFTDGETTTGVAPGPIAAAAKAAGIIIYCIGLVGSGGIDVDALNDWASDPDASHVAVTPNDEDLEDLFENLAANISKPGATNIILDEVIISSFTITSIVPPSKGTAVMINETTLQWRIPELGVSGNEGATLEFYAKHTGDGSGTMYINESISYSDTEGNAVSFPNPSVTVNCGEIVLPEECPIPVDMSLTGCQDVTEIDLGDVYMQSMGRIAQIDVRLKNVCPYKRVALAVILTEVDQAGQEHQRGLKAFTIPAHSYPECRDIVVRCIKFVLPEDLNVSGPSETSMCSTRNLRARFIAHHIDNNYQCCGSIQTQES